MATLDPRCHVWPNCANERQLGRMYAPGFRYSTPWPLKWELEFTGGSSPTDPKFRENGWGQMFFGAIGGVFVTIHFETHGPYLNAWRMRYLPGLTNPGMWWQNVAVGSPPWPTDYSVKPVDVEGTWEPGFLSRQFCVQNAYGFDLVRTNPTNEDYSYDMFPRPDTWTF